MKANMHMYGVLLLGHHHHHHLPTTATTTIATTATATTTTTRPRARTSGTDVPASTESCNLPGLIRLRVLTTQL